MAPYLELPARVKKKQQFVGQFATRAEDSDVALRRMGRQQLELREGDREDLYSSTKWLVMTNRAAIKPHK